MIDSFVRHLAARLTAAGVASLMAVACAEGQPDALARKERSEARLQSLGIPTLDGLPMIEGESEARIRAPQTVARRALVLFVVVHVGHGAPRDTLTDWLREHDLWSEVSPRERAFLTNPAPTRQQTIDATWRAEALWPLLWALGRVDTLDVPRGDWDAEQLQRVLGPQLNDPSGFIRNARLRPTSAILDATDLIYRMHWATRQAELDGQDPPAGLNPGVVMERHYALNWLTYYADDWDEITTDT